MQFITLKKSTANSIDTVVIALLALGPLCLLSIRSWTNIFVILLILVTAWQLACNTTMFSVLRGQYSTWWVIAALISPFVAVVIGQFMRWKIHPELMDGPSRSFLVIFVFIYLLQKPIDFVRLLEWSIPLSLLILGGFLAIHPYGWSDMTSGRFSTKAIDPLSLGQYTLFMAFFCLLTINIYDHELKSLKLLKLLGIIIGLWISFGTGSRSAWTAIPFLSLLWIFGRLKIRSHKKTTLLIISLILLGFSIYKTSPSIHERIESAINEYADYFHGTNRDTSPGIRLSLLRASSILFINNPLSGYGDTNYPDLSTIPQIASFNSEILENALINNGVHNEIMQNSLRSGIFGLISSLLMLGVPAIIFYRGINSKTKIIQTASLTGLCYIGSMFFFGLSTETFNMKYSISFYALMISALAAQVLRPQLV